MVMVITKPNQTKAEPGWFWLQIYPLVWTWLYYLITITDQITNDTLNKRSDWPAIDVHTFISGMYLKY